MTDLKPIRRGNDAAIANIACAVVFCLFSIVYLFYQADLLAMQQNVLSHGITRYNRTIGAVVITALLLIVQLAIDAFTRYGIKHPSITYIPSLMLLTMLTDISHEASASYPQTYWAWLAPLVLVVFIVAAWLSLRSRESAVSDAPRSAYTPLWTNLLTMALMITAVCATANTSRSYHARLHMERLVANREYAEAAAMPMRAADATPETTMLRAFALSRTAEMGERLFQFPLCGGADALLPNADSTTCRLFSDVIIKAHVGPITRQPMRTLQYLRWLNRHHLGTSAAHDYLLCALLMDCRLDEFAQEISRMRVSNLDTLPQHYREALTLYSHIRTNPRMVYHNAVMDADYDDMQQMQRKYTNPTERRARIGETYGKTYWHYYMVSRQAGSNNRN